MPPEGCWAADPWGSVAGLPDVKRRLQQAVVWPLSQASAFQRLGIAAPSGVLLYGPPGLSFCLQHTQRYQV